MATSLRSCRICQSQVLESFIPFAGLSLAASRSQVIHRALHPQKVVGTTSKYCSRSFHTTLARHEAPQRSDAQESLSAPVTQRNADSPPLEQPSTSTTDASIPWYLRVSTPTPPTPQNLPNPALQDLPPLPIDPPSILQPILAHLSLSVGLDALTLLDLRGLTPPSALGSNLIMILGTARSEKHLNTSADRFCRWIRSTYKLRPYADGLLGRNELKLKLRRRNKKLKLAQSVGNTMFDADKGYDDGITTGWICCNLGSVDSAAVPEVESQQDGTQATAVGDDSTGMNTSAGPHQVFSQKDQERPLEDEDEYSNPSDEEFTYRGFGNASMAPKIVVQMFTEQKRAEMDLEGLWEARIKRRDAKEERQDRLFETSVIEKEIQTPGVRRVDGEEEDEAFESSIEGRDFEPMRGRVSR